MVYLFLANGFEEIEALCPLDFLRRAGQEVKTVGVNEKIITGSHNISVVCDLTATELDLNSPFDMIILPGGLPGSTNLDQSPVVDYFIKRATKEDKYICAICAAPFMLGKRGLLSGKHACCYPGFENQLSGATIETGVCVDGKIITASAMGKSHEFSLAIIEALCGQEMKEKLKKAVLL